MLMASKITGHFSNVITEEADSAVEMQQELQLQLKGDAFCVDWLHCQFEMHFRL